MTDTCEMPKCKKEPVICYLGKWLCEDCWEKYESEKLKTKLGIKNEKRTTTY